MKLSNAVDLWFELCNGDKNYKHRQRDNQGAALFRNVIGINYLGKVGIP